MPFRIKPERSEPPEHLIQSSTAKGCDIFDDDIARMDRFNRFDVLEPETASLTCEADAFSGEADVLAGESATQQIDRFDSWPIDGTDIAVSPHVGPVLGEHSLTPRVDFDLPLHVHSGSFKSKVKSSNSGEQAADCEHYFTKFLLWTSVLVQDGQ